MADTSPCRSTDTRERILKLAEAAVLELPRHIMFYREFVRAVFRGM